MDIDPRRLRVLLAIARTGGVLAAANELRLTPSAVSQQLNRLEQEAGRALVLRTPKGSLLTAAGLALAEAAEEIERVLSLARTRMEGGGEPTGVVRLGGFTSFLRAIVIPHLPEWRKHYPHLQLRVVEDEFPSLMRLLRQRELDAVVVELDSAAAEQRQLPAGVSEEPLLDEPWKLVVPAGTLLAPDKLDLARMPLPWLGVKPESASASVLGRLLRATGSHSETVHQHQETLTALALVAAGEGATVVPALALSGIVQDGVEVLDVPGLGTRRIVLRRFDQHRPISMPVDTLARLLRESIATLSTSTTPSDQ